MKTLREALDDAFRERIGMSGDLSDAEYGVLEKHLSPLLAQPVDAAAQRKAEVARIAEAIFIACQNFNSSIQELCKGSFNDAEKFVAYKENLK